MDRLEALRHSYKSTINYIKLASVIAYFCKKRKKKGIKTRICVLVCTAFMFRSLNLIIAMVSMLRSEG